MSDCTRPNGRLQILLSTYNGGRYLEEQLESCRDMARAWSCQLLVRDDGSTDETRSVLTDEALRPVGETAFPQRGLTFYNAMLQNPCPGHTQILNKPLMDRLKRSCHPDMISFDWWVYLLAAAFGRIVFSPEPTVWHRQHRNNFVGCPSTRRDVLMGRAARVLRGEGKNVSRQLQGLPDCAGAEIPDAYRMEVERFLEGRISSSARIRYFFYGNVYRQSKLDSFLFRWIYLLGGY